MADFYDSQGNYIETVLYPGTMGYPYDTSDMDEDEISQLEPIIIKKYEDDE
ncbi:MAG: hypothetical protein FMNOHCHN_03406 [Ignavibacteriaceae bacterium]|nr:hypothetical protein [Ignavibacteriaceae bacterium]